MKILANFLGIFFYWWLLWRFLALIVNIGRKDEREAKECEKKKKATAYH